MKMRTKLGCALSESRWSCLDLVGDALVSWLSLVFNILEDLCYEILSIPCVGNFCKHLYDENFDLGHHSSLFDVYGHHDIEVYAF